MPLFLLAVAGFISQARAADWNIPEQELARKIVALTGSEQVSLSFENRSSLGRRDSEVIQNGLRSALENAGAHITNPQQSVAAVKIFLSENLNSYVWVAQVHRADGGGAVVMVSAARPERTPGAQDAVPLSIRRIQLWTQPDPILDIAVLEENSAPTRLAVLSAARVSVYRLTEGKWQQEQSAEIAHAQPWPRDLRGRLVSTKDHLLDVYLPGTVCHSTGSVPLVLNCRDSDDPWPLIGDSIPGVPAVRAFFTRDRNFFMGDLTPGIGRFSIVPRFYSAAPLVRQNSPIWILTATDGLVHIVDGASDQALHLAWGSDLASVKTACGAAWQVLATSSESGPGDSVRAYEIPDRDPVAVSAAVDFPEPISALWSEARGDTAIAVTKNPVTGNYEAFRLAVACNQ